MKRLSPLDRSKLPDNDLGNARRLYEAAGGRLLWLADAAGGKGAWVAFDGVRWSADEGPMRAQAFAQAAAVAILAEAAALRDAEPEELSAVYGPKFTGEMVEKRVGQLYGWSVSSGDMSKINGMLNAFKSLRDDEGNGDFLTQVWAREFDADPLAYHCSNGTLEFVQEGGVWSHRFHEGHRPEDRFMQVAGVAYEAGALAPAWAGRMEIMHRDPVQRTALQRIYGMSLTALISDQAFYVFQGKGQDGKSVTNDIVVKLHGAYARRADPKTFLEGPSQASAAHQSDIVRLAGDIRLVVMDEPKKGSTWDGQRIKQATGSEMIARGAHATTEVSFSPHWQLIAECNHLPRPPSDDRGFQRRLKLYPWVVQFGITPGADGKPVPDEPVDLVKDRLMGEASGILNWMIAGAVEWLNERVIPKPAASIAAITSFWDVSSALGEFIKQRCNVADPDARTEATALYQAFKQFCVDRGDKEDRIMSQTAFGRALNDLQIYSYPNNVTKKKERHGIRLLAEGELAAEAAAAAPENAVQDAPSGRGATSWDDVPGMDDEDPLGG